ncbi:MAG TPA: glutamine synthetase family protein [Acidimicrobiales bacterium]|jgi:glutamine synthetase|nr:glutamine synthetase family protein [Acidimicrobiales bacterium]
MLTVESLRQQIAAGAIDTVVVAFPDLQGRPVGKRVTGPFFLEHVLAHGIEVCDYLLAVDVDMDPLPGYRFANWDSGYGDMNAVIDVDTIRPLPWLEGSALVLCDLLTMQGQPVEVSPRQILRRQLERAAEHGLVVKCATELEFYLFRDSFEEAAAKGWQDLSPHADTIEDYQLLQTSRDEYIIGRIRNEMLRAGIPIEFSKGEAGRGQHEINVTYGDGLEVADRHVVFKNGVKEIAAQHGRAATFMAKWSMDSVGSSCHLHTSLWDATSGAPLMAGGAGEDHPSDLSVVGRQFLAGQLHAGRQLAWCFAPYVNSYRRYVPGSWAPTALVWGDDNRTCGFRVVGHGSGRRVENRVPGADVNPYLALAAAIAGGLWGIDHGTTLEPGFVGNAYEADDVPRIPTTLVEAIAELESSEVAVEAFGPDVHHHLVNTARQEWSKANQVVTDWELARNFERI